MYPAILRDGKRKRFGKWSAEICLPTIRRNIGTIDIVPEWLWDQVTDIPSVAGTPLDEDFLELSRGYLGGVTCCWSWQHTIRTGCLAQVYIGEGAPLAANRYLAAKGKQ